MVCIAVVTKVARDVLDGPSQMVFFRSTGRSVQRYRHDVVARGHRCGSGALVVVTVDLGNDSAPLNLGDTRRHQPIYSSDGEQVLGTVERSGDDQFHVRSATRRSFRSCLRRARHEVTLENETTTSPVGVFGGETVHGDVAEAIAETLGQTEMELADRVGVVGRDFFERTAPENEG